LHKTHRASDGGGGSLRGVVSEPPTRQQQQSHLRSICPHATKQECSSGRSPKTYGMIPRSWKELLLVGVSHLGRADGFPSLTVQNDLTPELQDDKRKQVIGVITALRGVVGN